MRRRATGGGAVGLQGKLKDRLRRVPLLMELRRWLGLARALRGTGNSRFLYPYFPGHYYSPLPDYRSVLANLANKSEAGYELPGIDLAEEGQLELLRAFVGLYPEMPFPARPDGSLRYYYENGWFGPADATILYSMLRHYRPERVVEVGSGFSSALMLDVNDLFLKGVQFAFIEPYPQRLYGLFSEADRANNMVLEEQVQDVPLAVFEALRANDILFVDSSHVVKIGSDLVHILFEALPRLKPGVVVHFHDIFWPFEYPREWFDMGRAWNEVYFLRAFLQYNSAFRVLYHSPFMAQHHTKVLERDLPLGLIEPTSLWLVKV